MLTRCVRGRGKGLGGQEGWASADDTEYWPEQLAVLGRCIGKVCRGGRGLGQKVEKGPHWNARLTQSADLSSWHCRPGA